MAYIERDIFINNELIPLLLVLQDVKIAEKLFMLLKIRSDTE